MAYTSERAFAAAILPKRNGSSTMGGKKSIGVDEGLLVVEPQHSGILAAPEVGDEVGVFPLGKTAEGLVQHSGPELGAAAGETRKRCELHAPAPISRKAEAARSISSDVVKGPGEILIVPPCLSVPMVRCAAGAQCSPLRQAIARCVEIQGQLVQRNPFVRNGERAQACLRAFAVRG